MMKNSIILVLMLVLISCSNDTNKELDKIATDYVKLVLATGEYDDNYVDAYFGPDSLKNIVKQEKLTLEEIEFELENLIKRLNIIEAEFNYETEYKVSKRLAFLKGIIKTVKTRNSFLIGREMTFDEESQGLFNVTAPSKEYSEYDRILVELDKTLPGEGNVNERFVNFRKQFIVPDDKIDTVFRIAIKEGKNRTQKHIQLPEEEEFILEYVTDKSWGGYNWFKGDAKSLIQINLDFPIYIDRAVGLACHEGYPGHHVYHSLIDEVFVKQNRQIEFTIYPLFSPLAVLSEGTANYGIKVAFPKEERIKYEKEVLFPLAGLNVEEADRYYEILNLISDLNYATVDIARDFLDREIDKEEAIELIMKYKLRTREHAEANLKFYEQYRSYIITYYIGKELCEHWVESQLNDKNDNKKRWEIFEKLLVSPYLPSDLL